MRCGPTKITYLSTLADVFFSRWSQALEPHRLRAERDAYICGFALFFCFVIPMVYQLALEAQSKVGLEARTFPTRPCDSFIPAFPMLIS